MSPTLRPVSNSFPSIPPGHEAKAASNKWSSLCSLLPGSASSEARACATLAPSSTVTASRDSSAHPLCLFLLLPLLLRSCSILHRLDASPPRCGRNNSTESTASRSADRNSGILSALAYNIVVRTRPSLSTSTILLRSNLALVPRVRLLRRRRRSHLLSSCPTRPPSRPAHLPPVTLVSPPVISRPTTTGGLRPGGDRGAEPGHGQCPECALRRSAKQGHPGARPHGGCPSREIVASVCGRLLAAAWKLYPLEMKLTPTSLSSHRARHSQRRSRLMPPATARKRTTSPCRARRIKGIATS